MSEVAEIARTQAVVTNNAVLAALRAEARRALLENARVGWPAVIDDLRALAGELSFRMERQARFDKALAGFVSEELRQLAAEIRQNLNLREEPQWPK